MRDNGRFYIPVLTFLTLSSVVFLVIMVSRVNGWPLCETSQCTIQAWLSATSGWVGFGAAAVGAYFVYHQLAEQRKQTAFMLGDGKATVELIRASGRLTSGIIRIVNWNRRTLVVQAITVVCAQNIPKPSQFIIVDADGEASTYIGDDGWITDRPRIEGSINRQGAPNFIDFRLGFNGSIESALIKRGTAIDVGIEIKIFHPENGYNLEGMKLQMPLRGLFPKTDANFD